MIISASRRTDIPAFHADWMMNRLREGFVCIRNPYNPHHVSRVSLRREDAEAIVFWTKDAANMLEKLNELEGRGYRYLFQYTLTPYGREIERGVDHARAFDSLLRLSERIGKDRVIWRYDPILLTDEWTIDRHMRAFSDLCGRLEGATGRCVFSFIDLYGSVKRNAPHLRAPDENQMRMMAREIAVTAKRCGMLPSACAEKLDFTEEGLEPMGCIDRRDIERVLGMPVRVQKDPGQRAECRCIKSVDIGAYDTCLHDCAYCYAKTRKNVLAVNPDDPLLGGTIAPEDRIMERKEKGIAQTQVSFLD